MIIASPYDLRLASALLIIAGWQAAAVAQQTGELHSPPVVIQDVVISETVVGEVVGESEPIQAKQTSSRPKTKRPSSASDLIGFGDWVGYNAVQSNTTWLADGDLGMVSFEGFPTLEFGQNSQWLFGSALHLVNGPAGSGIDSADLPPRLFDLQVAYHSCETFVGETMLDIKYGVGIFTETH